MRTPQEAFKDMCSCHGEIWTLTEDGPLRTTKDEDGNKVREGAVMPLEVYDLLKATGLRYAYRNWLMGYVEVLVSSSTKDKLEQEHTKAQLLSEALRLESERKLVRAETSDVLNTVRERIKDAVTRSSQESEDELFDLFGGVMSHKGKGDFTVN